MSVRSGSVCGRWRRALVAAGLAFTTATAACVRQPSPVVVALRSSPGTLDPHTHNELVAWSLLSNFYDALVRFSPTMTLEPALAVSWERVDTETVRFRLRPGVRFHNGARFGAEDVVASFRRASSHPESGVRHYLLGIKEVRAESELAVLVETEAPAPTLLNRLAFLFVVPRGDESRAVIADPVGTGPYRFVSRGADGRITGRAMETWRGRPEIREVVFAGIDDETERAHRFMAGEADLAVALPDQQIAEIQQSPGRQLVSQPILGVRMLVIMPRAANGTARAALADPRVRRALLAGIDRQGIVDRVFQGNATVASQYVQPVVFGYDPGVLPVPYDPAAARRLLVEAGFADGFEVEIGHGLIPEGLVASLTESLGRVGVRLRPVRLPFPQLLERVRAGTVPLMVYSRSCMSGDASEFLDSVIHTPDPERGWGEENYHGYSDPFVDARIEAASTELDRDRRLMLLQEAQRRALDGLPVLPLVVQWEHLGVSNQLEVVTRHDGFLWLASFRRIN